MNSKTLSRRFAIRCSAALAVAMGAAITPANEPGQSSPTKQIKDLGWLAEHWGAKQGETETEEHWLKPKGRLMLGVNRTVRKSGRDSFEFLRISETPNGLVYYASPSGRAAIAFRLSESGPRRAVFENVEHDFPQRIIYQREADKLNVRIEGKIRGESKTLRWTWDRLAADR